MSTQIGNNDDGPGSGNIDGSMAVPPPIMQQNFIIPFLMDSMSVSGAAQNNDFSDSSNPRLSLYDPVQQFQLGMAKIVTEMLTAWNDSIKEEAERVENELKSPAYLAWQEQHSTKYIAEQDIKAGKDLTIPTKGANDQQAAITTGTIDEKDRYAGLEERAALLAGMNSLITHTISNIESTRSSVSDPENSKISLTRDASGPDNSGYQPAAVMAASLAIGMGFVSSYSVIPDVASTSQIEVKPLRDSWNQINQSNDQITQTAGWFSAMWGIGLVYQLSAQNIAEMAGGHEKSPHKMLSFAKDYAENLLTSLKGDTFNVNLMALLTPMLEKSAEGKARPNPEMVALKGKIILLALALALVYKLELKSMDPNAKMDENTFGAMLSGKVDFSRNDQFDSAELKRQLVAYFQYNLNQLPEAEKTKVIEGILAYIGRQSNEEEPGLEGMLDQQKIFEDIGTEGVFNESIVDKRPIDS